MNQPEHLCRLSTLLAVASMATQGLLSAQTPEPVGNKDWYDDSATQLITPKQGWSPADSEWFYRTTQGSQLMPYAFFIHLEQAGSERLFRDEVNMKKFRCLPQPPTLSNQDGLPVGFVADEGSTLPKELLTDQRSLGFTCAACHTAQINYKDTAIRIDGGPTLADMDGLLSELTDAINATLADQAKFDRFSAKVLGAAGSDDQKKAQLKTALEATAKDRNAYQKLNHSDTRYGFARMDAFGRIFNRALTLVDPTNGVKANAPVSYPQLWDSPHANTVQWTGNASNDKPPLGALSRNVGEVVGVFAAIDTSQVHQPIGAEGYKSSANFANLLELEKRLGTLLSPLWSDTSLPPVAPAMVEAGKQLYFGKYRCDKCHQPYTRDSEIRAFESVMTDIAELKTDPTAAQNIHAGEGKTGILKGGSDPRFPTVIYEDTASADQITKDTITRVLMAMPPKPKPDQAAAPVPDKAATTVTLFAPGLKSPTVAAKSLHPDAEPSNHLQYRARPLNGIWATAPFLHNGSVPTLYDLLLPESPQPGSPGRPKKFYVGRREFDPVKVGYETEKNVPGTFEFDTSQPGNSNAGHNYGTEMSEEERWQLVEYLKTL